MLPRFFRNRQYRTAALALCFSLVGAASMVYYQFGSVIPRVQKVHAAKRINGRYFCGNDFYPIWLTSREWLDDGRDPYSMAVTRDIQIGLFGRPLEASVPTDPPVDYRTFAYPAFTDILFWPVSLAPFSRLRIVWVVLLALLTAGGVFFWAQALYWRVSRVWLGIIVLLTLCSYPELEGIYAGQLGLLVGFFLAASVLALVRGRLLLAGILMALTTIKPQMTLLAIVYLFFWSAHDWRRRSLFSLAFFGTMFLLVGASLAVWPRWIQSWTRVILGYHHYAMPPLTSVLLASSLGSHGGTAVSTIALIAALVLAWRGRAATAGSHEFWLTLSLLLAITAVTLLPGQAVYDQGILLPGILLLASRRRELSQSWVLKALLATGIAVLLWPWIASFALIAFHPLLPQPRTYSNAVFALPLRTAAVFPFVVLGSLVLALRAKSQQHPLLSTSGAPQ